MSPAAGVDRTFLFVRHPNRALLAALLVLSIVGAYYDSFSGPFVFDDVPTIVENPTLRQLSDSLRPPNATGLTVNGRPVVNLSLALNYAFGGLQPRGYHVTNLAIHLGTSLLLFGLIGRTVLRTAARENAASIAFGATLLWALHPLQTGAVTYIVQRSEGLMGFFCLLTLYAFVRSTDSPSVPTGVVSRFRPRHETSWQVLALLACTLGMATKEVMVSVPLLALLYDRTFVAGDFRSALRMRRWFYAALASTWILLAWLMVHSGARGGTAGFGLGVSGWSYVLTQAGAVFRYLQLAMWPADLVFDYGGMVLAKNFAAVAPQVAAIAVLVAATAYALRRRPWLGFIGAWFFTILAPTSSFVPLADTYFEHRMYLPLAALTVLAALGLHLLLRRGANLVFLALALGLGVLTAQRNQVYRSEVALWRDTVSKRPENVRAHYTLGSVLFEAGDVAGAMVEYETALRLKPDSAPAHNNLGNALVRSGRTAEALAHYDAALAAVPAAADTHNNLANALVRLGRLREAREHYETALKLRPAFADAHNNLGNVLAQLRDFPAAAKQYRAALRLRPDLADAEANLGNVLAQSGDPEEAVRHYQAALRLRPDFLDAHLNLATALTELRRWNEAAAQYEKVLALAPNHASAHEALSLLRLRLEFQRSR